MSRWERFKGRSGTFNYIQSDHYATPDGPLSLSHLGGVTTTGALDGQLLGYNATTALFEPKVNLAVANLNDLLDVNDAAKVNGSVLKWDSGTSKWIAGSLSLDDLSNVSLSSPTDGQTLVYSGGQFVNSGFTLSSLTDTTISGTPATGAYLRYSGATWADSAGLAGVTEGASTYNTFLGTGYPTGITSGTKNTTLGYEAGTDLTSGSDNCFFGYLAGQNITTGTRNIIIGGGATTGTMASLGSGAYDNIFIGTACNTANNAFENVWIGNSIINTTGTISKSVSIGYLSSAHTEGVAIGYNANAGTQCVAAGYQAGGNGQGVGYVAIGYQAGDNMDSSSQYNTLIGYKAGKSITGTGSNNTIIGYSAGSGGTALTTGSNNTIVGYNAQVDSATRSGCVVLGSGATSTDDNQLTIQVGSNVLRSKFLVDTSPGSGATNYLHVTIGGTAYTIPCIAP